MKMTSMETKTIRTKIAKPSSGPTPHPKGATGSTEIEKNTTSTQLTEATTMVKKMRKQMAMPSSGHQLPTLGAKLWLTTTLNKSCGLRQLRPLQTGIRGAEVRIRGDARRMQTRTAPMRLLGAPTNSHHRCGAVKHQCGHPRSRSLTIVII